jgi:hypothetical protein
MTIEYTYGLEPLKYDSKSFDSVKESERRAAEHLQGNAGVVNPLETQIAFPSGLGDYVITDGGSGYLTPPTVTFVNSGSFRGSGAIATATVEAINPSAIPPTDGSVIGFTITNVGSGYTTIPKVVLTGNEIVTTFTDDDINFTTDVITKVAHGMSDGDRIHFTTDNVLPLGLYTTDAYGNIDKNPDFYVRDVTTDTFKLSKTSGGTAVDIWPRDAKGTAIIVTGVAAGEPTSNMVATILVVGLGEEVGNTNDRGRRYSSVPTITIEAPPEGGTQATATCTLTNDGLVDKVTMINRGLGYITAPSVTFSGGHGTHTIRKGGGAAVTAKIGTGATAVPITDASGTITDITVLTSGGGTGATATPSITGDSVAGTSGLSGGSGYGSQPTISFTGGGGTGAAASANISGGAVTSITITAPGAGYTSAPALVFNNTGTGGTGASATAVLEVHTYLTSITLNSGGTGYTSAPVVVFDNVGTGGSGATATATTLDGIITGVTITAAGSGYTSLPAISFFGGGSYVDTAVTITGGGGTGATATATILGGAISDVTVTAAGTSYASLTSLANRIPPFQTNINDEISQSNADIAQIDIWMTTSGGSGYTSAPTVTFTGGGGSGAAGTANISGGEVTSITMTNTGSGYSSAPSISYTGGGGSGAGGTPQMAGGSVLSVRLSNLPIPWETAGYTVGDLVTIKASITAYVTSLNNCKTAVDAMMASIGPTTGTFRQHNERWCGLQDIGTNPFIPNYYILMITAMRMEKEKDKFGVPFENYVEKILNCLFTGDDTIDTATENMLSDPPWSGTPYDLAIYGVQAIILNATSTPSAILTVINGFGTKIGVYEALVVADNAAFAAHVTNDMTEYANAEAFMTNSQDGKKHNGWWVDPYRKFVYPNVVGSQTANEIIDDIDNEVIT